MAERKDFEAWAAAQNSATADLGTYYTSATGAKPYTGWSGGSVTGADVMDAVYDSIKHNYDVSLDPRANPTVRSAIDKLYSDIDLEASRLAASGNGTYDENRNAFLTQYGLTGGYNAIMENLQKNGSLGLKDMNGKSLDTLGYGISGRNAAYPNGSPGLPELQINGKNPAAGDLAILQANGGFWPEGMSPKVSPGSAVGASVSAPTAPGAAAGSGAWTFDLESDPVWRAVYAQQEAAAKKGMDDTLAKIAARTGGMPSSYAGSAAQQVYDSTLAGTIGYIPEIFDASYGRWMDQQQLGIQLEQLAMQKQQLQHQIEMQLSELQMQREQGDWERAQYSAEQAQALQSQQAELLMAMMEGYGYQPTPQELAAAGLSQNIADAILASRAQVSVGGYGGQPITSSSGNIYERMRQFGVGSLADTYAFVQSEKLKEDPAVLFDYYEQWENQQNRTTNPNVATDQNAADPQTLQAWIDYFAAGNSIPGQSGIPDSINYLFENRHISELQMQQLLRALGMA